MQTDSYFFVIGLLGRSDFARRNSPNDLSLASLRNFLVKPARVTDHDVRVDHVVLKEPTDGLKEIVDAHIRLQIRLHIELSLVIRKASHVIRIFH